MAPFTPSRITSAVLRALREVGRADPGLAEEATTRALKALARRVRGTPGIEEIQDAVEGALMSMGLDQAARACLSYRRRAEVREAKRLLGVRDDVIRSGDEAALPTGGLGPDR